MSDGYDVARISRHLSFINVMTYDLHGSWDSRADHHAPLHRRDHDDWPTLTTVDNIYWISRYPYAGLDITFIHLFQDSGISLWHQQGAPLEKLLLGTPFYGRSFTLTGRGTEPGAPSSGAGGEPGQFTEEAGFLAYFEVCQLLQEGGWTQTEDSDGNPYIYKVDNIHTHALHYATTRSI